MSSNGANYNTYSIPIEVSSESKQNEFTIVSVPVDFNSIVGQKIVDERTLKLYLIDNDGSRIEQPLQFNSQIQKRHSGRHLEDEIPPSVSWAGNWSVDNMPDDVKVSGVLTWAVSNAKKSRYELVFGSPRYGSFVQVPYQPNNLFYLDNQKKPAPVKHFPIMQIRPLWPLDGKMNILKDGEVFTSYNIPGISPDSMARRPYFYPVNGPHGINLTELGKPHDPTGSHAHHYSLWIAHASVNGHDFWSEKGGKIIHQGFDLIEDGPIYARLVTRNLWIINGKEILKDKRDFKFYNTPHDFRLIDIDLKITPAGSEPVELGETPFGFLSARVAQSMTVFDGGGEIVNSRGKRDEHGAHWQRGEWIDQSGPIAPGKWGGVAIFDHPSNPGHPTHWHCRNDGWAGASFNLQQPRIMKSNEPLNLKYRVCLHRGNAVDGQVARRYGEYVSNPSFQFDKIKPI